MVNYFVLRIVRARDDHSREPVHGMVERLGTQQKQEFAGSTELLQLLEVELADGTKGD